MMKNSTNYAGYRATTLPDKRRSDLQMLTAVLEFPLQDGERTAFEEMKGGIETHQFPAMSVKQREWVQRVLEDHTPKYENLVSAGKVPRGKEVETPFVLRPENLPKKPPGRR